MGIYWPLEEQMLAAGGEVLLERLPVAGRGGRLGRESGGWQRSEGEVLLLRRPLEIFLGGHCWTRKETGEEVFLELEESSERKPGRFFLVI